MFRSHVIKLDPTHKQEVFFRQCVGAARFAYNWALTRWNEQYAAGESTNDGKLNKELNTIKREQFPWMLDLPKRVVQEAVIDLGTAFKNFFASCKGKRKGAKVARPKYKSRHKSKQSARLDDGPGTFRLDGKRVKLPKLGWIKTHQELRFQGRPLSTRLSYVGGRWWLSVLVEIADPAPNPAPTETICRRRPRSENSTGALRRHYLRITETPQVSTLKAASTL